MIAPYTLPAQLTTFIGRERELDEATRLLAKSRLVTLLGAGGSGKTRLALQLASLLSTGYPGGVHFIDLAALTDPAYLPQTVALGLGLREQQDRDLPQALAAHIGDTPLLLILDNCEHLLDGCAALASLLLTHCPNLRILATSRELLNVRAEALMHVPGLTLPADPEEGIPRRGLPPPAELQEYEAIRLFVERARFKRPGFDLTPHNAPHIARLCRALDGMPLAIELAAARASILSPEEIVSRLDRRFSLLTEGARVAPTRQRTLRGAIDWSYELLDEDERALLRRLSVFAGGFSLAAVIGICAPPDNPDEFAVIDLLSHLADKSLLAVEEAEGETRYRLLDSIRQYASEMLEESGKAPTTRDRHLAWHLDLAERAKSELQGPNQKEWLDRLQIEYNNMRVALGWGLSREGGPGDTGLRLMAALWRFWYVRGYFTEGRRWLEQAFTASPNMPPPTRAILLYGLGTLIAEQGDLARAGVTLRESLQLYRELGDKRGVANTLSNLATRETAEGNYEEAKRLLGESIQIKRSLDDKLGVAGSLNNLGNVMAAQGDYAQAKETFTQTLQLMRELGEKRGVAFALNNLGQIAQRLGDYSTASDQIQESLQIKRDLGDRSGIGISLIYLGEVETYKLNYKEARSLFEQALSLLKEVDDGIGVAIALRHLGELSRYQGRDEEAYTHYSKALVLARENSIKEVITSIVLGLGLLAWRNRKGSEALHLFIEGLLEAQRLGIKDVLAQCLYGLAAVADVSGLFQRAATLFGAAQRILGETGYKPHPVDAEALDQLSSALQTKLGPTRWAEAIAAGRAMSLEDTTNLAVSELPLSQDSTSPPKYPNGLTRREVEVLRLVARGLTDAEIAEILTISPHTVHAHVHSIYGKLDVASRAAAIRFALDYRLG